jgi:hypothetical protein
MKHDEDRNNALRVNDVGEFVRFRSCERRFRLGLRNRQEARRLPFHERLFGALDPVLQMEGAKRERTWTRMLMEAGYVCVRSDENEELLWSTVRERFASVGPGQKAFATEVTIEGDVGAWHVSGRMDFVILDLSKSPNTIRIVETKASRRDRTYHRIQVALYAMLLRDELALEPLVIGATGPRVDQLEAVVARIDEATNSPQLIDELPALDLDVEIADITQLLAPDGPFSTIAVSSLDQLPYQLDSKCDDCVFSTDCFPDTALARRIQLLGVSPSIVRALAEHGLTTIDQLAELDPSGDLARDLRADSSFTENLQSLVLRADVRRHSLPGQTAQYDVVALPSTGYGAVPDYEIGGHRVVRVYLSVDYDYPENRIGALSAHVTTSHGQIATAFEEVDGKWKPHPTIGEVPFGTRARAVTVDQLDPVSGVDVIHYNGSRWTGRYDEDTGRERSLIENFLHELVDAMDAVAEADRAPIHFYVWAPSEIQHLVEGCSRAGSDLLGHLRHLMGCRESLEQLMYSSVQREVDQRFALAWTGRGLSVVTSLRWFGHSYHWTRQVGRNIVQLDSAFTQDIFDFKTTLGVTDDGKWAKANDKTAHRHLFEIRSRFYDSLSAPYWRVVWDQLPAPDEVDDRRLRGMIDRYRRTAEPNYLREYLRARVHALRWVEEKISKNREIQKPALSIRELRTFELNTNTVEAAAVEFLRLDQHVKTTEWVSSKLVPPSVRVAKYESIPIRDVRATSANHIQGTLDYERYGIDATAAADNCSFGDGGFVRLTPCPDGPESGQNVGLLFRLGKTAVLDGIDWESGEVALSVIPQIAIDRYRLQSFPVDADFDFADFMLIEESPSDFVAPKVERRLTGRSGTHVFGWLDPTGPEVPVHDEVSGDLLSRIQELLQALTLPPDGYGLNADQLTAILEGVNSTIHLLQGPPGTGKTHTSAVDVLLRVLLSCRVGDILLISGPTHRAVDNLMERIESFQSQFADTCETRGFNMPRTIVAKVHSNPTFEASRTGIQDLRFDRVRPFNALRSSGVLVLGGLPNALLKAAHFLSGRPSFVRNPDGSFARALLVDEGSMMVFPHFLALSTLVESEGYLAITGDHRQLAPIVAHDWEREDRPPTVIYQPYVSAYEAIRNIGTDLNNPRQVALSALEYSFRLPPEIRNLINRIYAFDSLHLTGPSATGLQRVAADCEGWSHIWCRPTGLFLVIHRESQSRRANPTEVEIVDLLLKEATSEPEDSVAIITPHRSQRLRLVERLGNDHRVRVIDTVERLQGGESPTVIVSATASDPAAIAVNVEFLLNLNRSNVAFSRAQRRLIVVCAQSLLDHVPAEFDHYQSAYLWKSIREVCSEHLDTLDVEGTTVRIMTCPPPQE